MTMKLVYFYVVIFEMGHCCCGLGVNKTIYSPLLEQSLDALIMTPVSVEYCTKVEYSTQ